MRTVKLVIIALIALALVVVMAANMAPVTLHLIPERFAPGLPTVTSPLALVIVVAFAAGLLFGLLMEYVREHKYRRRLDQKRREVSTLRDENVRLAKRLSDKGDDVAAIAG